MIEIWRMVVAESTVAAARIQKEESQASRRALIRIIGAVLAVHRKLTIPRWMPRINVSVW